MQSFIEDKIKKTTGDVISSVTKEAKKQVEKTVEEINTVLNPNKNFQEKISGEIASRLINNAFLTSTETVESKKKQCRDIIKQMLFLELCDSKKHPLLNNLEQQRDKIQRFELYIIGEVNKFFRRNPKLKLHEQFLNLLDKKKNDDETFALGLIIDSAIEESLEELFSCRNDEIKKIDAENREEIKKEQEKSKEEAQQLLCKLMKEVVVYGNVPTTETTISKLEVIAILNNFLYAIVVLEGNLYKRQNILLRVTAEEFENLKYTNKYSGFWNKAAKVALNIAISSVIEVIITGAMSVGPLKVLNYLYSLIASKEKIPEIIIEQMPKIIEKQKGFMDHTYDWTIGWVWWSLGYPTSVVTETIMIPVERVIYREVTSTIFSTITKEMGKPNSPLRYLSFLGSRTTDFALTSIIAAFTKKYSDKIMDKILLSKGLFSLIPQDVKEKFYQMIVKEYVEKLCKLSFDLELHSYDNLRSESNLRVDEIVVALDNLKSSIEEERRRIEQSKQADYKSLIDGISDPKLKCLVELCNTSRPSNASNKSENEYWYSDYEISILIEHYLSEAKKSNVKIFHPSPANKKFLLETFDEFKKQDQKKDTIIIPVATNMLGENIEHEAMANHWVVLKIVINDDSKSIAVSYFDSKGQPMPEGIMDVLDQILRQYYKGYKRVEYEILQNEKNHIQSKDDDNNCGPLAVEAIKSCLFHNTLLPNKNLPIEEIRKEHNNIIDLKKRNTKAGEFAKNGKGSNEGEKIGLLQKHSEVKVSVDGMFGKLGQKGQPDLTDKKIKEKTDEEENIKHNQIKKPPL
jgi:hypothetical protein